MTDSKHSRLILLSVLCLVASSANSNSKCLPLAMSSHCDLGCDVGRWF